MASARTIRWLQEPEDKDYGAAESFLSLIVEPKRLGKLIDSLRKAPRGEWRAKDLLRAAELPAMKPKASLEVDEKLKKVKQGDAISPILLVGGLRPALMIADGYHRVSAAYWVHEDVLVPGRLLWAG